MSDLILFIPGDAQRGGSIAVDDFTAAADEQLSKALEGQTDDSLAEQVRSAVRAAKQLVKSGHAGEHRVVAVISCRVDPFAVPAGTGHIIGIEVTSRPSPVPVVPEAEAEPVAVVPVVEPVISTEADGPNASPHAVAAAEAHGVDLAGVTGTGKDGLITKGDVDKAAADAAAAAKAAAEGKEPAQTGS